MKKTHNQEPQVLFYQTDDGTTRVEVRMASFRVNVLATAANELSGRIFATSQGCV